MKRLIKLAAKLYPGPWRERYGMEFDALLDQAPCAWRAFWNVLWGAVRMNLSEKLAPGQYPLTALAITFSFWLLQRPAVESAFWLVERALTLIGIPVVRQGGVIELPQHQLSTAPGCNEIWPLLPAILLCGLWARTSQRGLLLAALPLAIATHATRLTLAGWMTESGFPHAAGVSLAAALAAIAMIFLAADRAAFCPSLRR